MDHLFGIFSHTGPPGGIDKAKAGQPRITLR